MTWQGANIYRHSPSTVESIESIIMRHSMLFIIEVEVPVPDLTNVSSIFAVG